MIMFENNKIILSFLNEWSQLCGTYNWYTFTFARIEFENEPYTGGWDFEFILLGLGFRFRYNYDFENSPVGKTVAKLEPTMVSGFAVKKAPKKKKTVL